MNGVFPGLVRREPRASKTREARDAQRKEAERLLGTNEGSGND